MTANFKDIRNHGFVRVGFVIPEVKLANPMVNAKRHIALFEKAYARGGMYVIAPELGLTGYSCGDLFHQRTLIDEAYKGLLLIKEESKNWKMTVSVGLPLEIGNGIYNCAATIYQGKILGITPKSYPPEYKEFYELRHFGRADDLKVTEMVIDGDVVAVGNNLIFESKEYKNLKIHTSVCEDDWTVIPPGSWAALNGATVMANLSASNITIGKEEFRENLMTTWSALRCSVQIYCAAGMGESTADLAWDGDGYIVERGYVKEKSVRYADFEQVVLADVDVETVAQERWWRNSFRENAKDNDKKMIMINFSGKLGVSEEVFEELNFKVDAYPFVPSNPEKLKKRTEEVFMIQAVGLMQRLKFIPADMRKIFLGLSGGLDSTQALLVAVKAMDMLKMERTNIKAITMPGFGTTDRTKNNAVELAKALGIEIKEVSVKELSKMALDNAGYDFDGQETVGFENAQAWARMYTLFTTSAVKRGIVLGTGDLTELLLGWCTVFADHASHYNVNAGVPKTLIKHEIRYAAEELFASEAEVKRILIDILETPISPELLSAKDGRVSQMTEDIVGPMELHDFFGYHLLRFGENPSKVLRLASAAFVGKYEPLVIKKWLAVFIKRFFANQFKRDTLPNGPKVGLLSVSPRGDWRMPSDVTADVWLADLEKNSL